jgi:poly-gamma-glutamate synthesis protein (capsule biosynthesis protein)
MINPRRNYIFWSLFALFLGFSIPLVSFSLLVQTFQSLDAFVYSSGQASLASAIQMPVVSMIFVGDIMLGRGVEESVLRTSAGDFSFLFRKITSIKDADVAFGNLEGTISDAGESVGNLYSFRFKPESLEALKKAGFDVLSVANNHAGDWGRESFSQNIFRLRGAGILPVGGGLNKNGASRGVVIERKGVRIGFLAFSDVGPAWFEAKKNAPGILLVDEQFPFLIKKASRQVDVLVVSLHFGQEYQPTPTTRQKQLARSAIDNGALVVVGHHTHVVQEVEAYKDGVIAYGLGNFIFDQTFSEETMGGLALGVYLEGDRLRAVKQNKIKINEFFQPELAEPGQAF